MNEASHAILISFMKTASGRRSLNANLISHHIAKGQQSASAQWQFEMEHYKVKVDIKSDSYDFQSSAVVSVWSKESLQWNRVGSIP